MITKGFVEELIDEYKVKVRMPIYDGVKSAGISVSTNELSSSIICTYAGIKQNFKIGDVVLVGFEDNDMGKPIIIGSLFCENMSDSLCDISADSISVKVNANLCEDTSIGDVSGEEIKNLKGLKGNVQCQIDLLNNEINNSLGTLLQSISGYDKTKTQVLKNTNGTISWVEYTEYETWSGGSY